MPDRILSSIGTKIILGVAVPAAAILTGMILFYSTHEEESLLKQNEAARLEMARSVIQGLNAVMMTGSAVMTQQFAEELKKVPGVQDFRILRNDGLESFQDNKTIDEVNSYRDKIVFKPRDEELEIRIIPADQPALLKALESKEMVSYAENVENARNLTFLTPIPNQDRCHRCHDSDVPIRGVVKLTTTMEPVYTAIQESRDRAFRILAVALSALLMLVFVMVRRLVVAPLTLVTSAMSRVAAGDLTIQVPELGQDELSRMAKSFNHMLTQLLHTYTGFQQERNKLNTIILSAREGIIVTDQENHVVLVNPSAERLLGKTAQQIVAEGFLHILDDPEYISSYINHHGHNHPEELVYKGQVLSVHAARILAPDGTPIGSAALIRDITEAKRLEHELRVISYTDKLTGIFNRRRMEELLNAEFDRAVRYHYPLSFLLFDVDHFKRFNDEHGHDQGDRVLQAIGALMKEHFRKIDFPCRYGGEEFCVILPSTPADLEGHGAWGVADRFRQRVEALVIDGLKVTISIGVAVYPLIKIKDPSEMIKVADNALYQAKRAGRNRVILAQSQE
ncbi:MAG: diguanylate cyclase [Magnetococcales bacterium]|nr:diguanylate cyclase [Magnetococcales bacterium]